MKAYLDNVIVSGQVRMDLEPTEMAAVQKVYEFARCGALEIATSREAWREQERARDGSVRAELQERRADVPVVADDHRSLGFSHLQNQYGGFISNPLVTDIVDEQLFARLKAAGLRDGDARHLMYAAANLCDRFVTLDPDFINVREVLQAHCQGLRIVRPSELVGELSGILP